MCKIIEHLGGAEQVQVNRISNRYIFVDLNGRLFPLSCDLEASIKWGRSAAYTWAKSEGIELFDKSVPLKNDRKLVKNLYAGLRFFAQQQFDAFTSQVAKDRCNEKTAR